MTSARWGGVCAQRQKRSGGHPRQLRSAATMPQPDAVQLSRRLIIARAVTHSDTHRTSCLLLQMPTSILVLPSYPAAFKGEAVSAVASAAAPLSRKVEPVGRAFQATKHPAPKPSSAEDDAAAAALASPTGVQLRDTKYDRYKKFDIDLGDYYSLLGLEEKMFDATKDEITEAYRTMCKVRRQTRDTGGWRAAQ